MEKKKIVILGAGFGGLKTAFSVSQGLRSLHLLDKYEVLLIDRHEHHTFTPLLYETATTSKEAADLIHLHNLVTHDIKNLIKNYPIVFIQDHLKSFEPKEGVVVLEKGGRVNAEFIVLAVGSEVNFFNIPGLKENALTLKAFLDAIKIRDAILKLTEEKGRGINVIVGGGGPTGVELSAELSNWCYRSELKISPKLNVTLVEAQPTILAGFIPRLAKKAEKRLITLGVALKTNAKISKVTSREVEFADGGTMPFDLFIWTGGVKTPDILLNLPLKTEERGRIETDETMACLPPTPDLELSCMVYGIGDNVCSVDSRTKKPVPAVAPAAIAQAAIAAHNILEDIKKKEGIATSIHRLYRPVSYPYVVPVGGKYAIAKIGPFLFCGFLGWLVKGFVELHYLLSIMPVPQAFSVWLRGFLVFAQNDRLG